MAFVDHFLKENPATSHTVGRASFIHKNHTYEQGEDFMQQNISIINSPTAHLSCIFQQILALHRRRVLNPEE